MEKSILMEIKHCQGCRDNFYNGNNNLGISHCWSFDKRKKLEWRLGPIGHWEEPPYIHKKKKRFPPCWHGDTNKSHWVKPGAINSQGYWSH